MTLSEEVQAPSAPEAVACNGLSGALSDSVVPGTEPVLHQRTVTGSSSSSSSSKAKENGADTRRSENGVVQFNNKRNGDCGGGGGVCEDGGDGLKNSGTGEGVDEGGGECIKKPDGSDGEEEEDPLSGLHIPRVLPNVVTIKKAIPAHCFIPNVWLSIYYMVKDFIIVAVLYFATEWSFQVLPHATQLVISPLYWLLQGVMFTAIFVVGHDGGHGSFSQSRLVNDLCGNICHAFLFCPYFMWKLTHKNHHKNTGNIDKEEVYYPVRLSDNKNTRNAMLPGFGLGIGWFTYLVRGYRPRKVGHFNPFHPMFKNHLIDCIISLVFLAGWLYCLNWYRLHFGLGSLIYHWAVPTLIFGSFIVIITFLHHTDEGVPWYEDRLWNYVRGQLSSVDRHYGWCHGIIHNIGTHQIHHLFPIIPHYRLEEATASFRKAFPDLICINNERILPAFYRMFKKYVHQSIIQDTTKVHVYR